MHFNQNAAEIAALVILTVWILRMVRPRLLPGRVVTPAFVVLCLLAVATIGWGVASVRVWRAATVEAVGVCVATLLVAGLAGLLRSRTVRLWRSPRGVMRRGSIVTVGAWLAWVAVHYGLDRVIDAVDPVSRLAQTTLWSGLAISLAAQGYALRRRAALTRDPDRV